MKRGVARAGLVAAAALVTSAGVALATGAVESIVGGDGSIQGCYQKQNGQLRVVRAASECRPSELPVRWSQRGVAGETGPRGPQGEQGPQGERGPQGEQGPSGVTCELEQRIKSALPSFALSAGCASGGGGGPANGTTCDDGDAATTGDVYSGGVCSGTPPICDDGDPSTIDAYLPGAGCVFVHNPADVAVERCNGLDDDGDGVVDEEFPQKGDQVLNGVLVCSPDGLSLLVVCSGGFVDADGDPATGCEQGADPDASGNTRETAIRLAGMSCVDTDGQIALDPNTSNPAISSTSDHDWYVVRATGGVCVNDFAARLSAGSGIVFDVLTSNEERLGLAGSVTFGAGFYDTDTDVYLHVHPSGSSGLLGAYGLEFHL